MIKVKELIEALKGADPEAVVILSRDPEGNGFETLCDIETENQVWSDEWGEIGFKELTPELIDDGYGEEDLCHEDDAVECIVLWP
jgi:hypothetical protein